MIHQFHIKHLKNLLYTIYDHNILLNSNTKLYIDQYKLKLATDIDEKSKELLWKI